MEEDPVMFERCHSPHDVAHVYGQYGFPVELTFGRTSMLTSARLGAVVMPPSLGQLVQELLGDAASAPVISHSGPDRRWIFLVGPNRSNKLGDRSLAELERHEVRLLDAGTRVWLPMSDSPIGWYWAAPPLEGASAAPSRTFVLGIARKVLDGHAIARSQGC
ncbi:hypothetical protein [Nocardia sp. NPDC049149]|uniref:hypothetical protein n=1 Tax=Nocardia sp. NPDC049149 TaxID=3364315 RepID=UPI00371EAAA9